MMVHLTLAPILAIIVFAVSLFAPTTAKRPFNLRSDLLYVPPVWESGYEVPLVGSLTCVRPESCTSSLPTPDSGKTLKQLTFGRGTFTYTCANTNPTDQPKYLSESIELYDVAAILPFIPNEATLHLLVPQFYAYDYSELQNSSLKCVGNIYTDYGATVVALYNFNTIPVQVNASILSPEDPAFNAKWVYSATLDGAWQVYRVETYAGAIPATCEDQPGAFEVGFAAEYWFFGP